MSAGEDRYLRIKNQVIIADFSFVGVSLLYYVC